MINLQATITMAQIMRNMNKLRLQATKSQNSSVCIVIG